MNITADGEAMRDIARERADAIKEAYEACARIAEHDPYDDGTPEYERPTTIDIHHVRIARLIRDASPS